MYKVLTVLAASPDHDFKARIVLPLKVMTELSVAIGDPLVICNASELSEYQRGRSPVPNKYKYNHSINDAVCKDPIKSAVGIAWPSNKISNNNVQLDRVLRINCDVQIGDFITISKVEDFSAVIDADYIYLNPILHDFRSDDRNKSDIMKNEDLVHCFLQQYLVGQYLMLNKQVIISIYGKNRRFIIENVIVTGVTDLQMNTIYHVNSGTRILISKEKEKKKNDVQSRLSFSDVGGLSKQIEQLREIIELPLKTPELFTYYSIKPPRGVLLYGPPGTGKTFLATVLASQTGVAYYSISSSEIMSQYYGESETKLKDLFDQARANKPCIIFIDEIDALAPKRESSESEVSKRIVGTLLALMDGMDSQSNSGLFIVGATNRPNALDPALRRPGRFDKEIEIPIPSAQGRLEILEVYLKNIPNDLEKSQIKALAERTHGYVGADLINLCKEAGLKALKRVYKQIKNKSNQNFENEKIPQESSIKNNNLDNNNNNNLDNNNNNNLDNNNFELLESRVSRMNIFETIEDDNNGKDKDKDNSSIENPFFNDEIRNYDSIVDGKDCAELSNIKINWKDILEALSEVRPSAMREIMVDIPKVRWSEIGGYEDAKQKLREAAEWPLKHPEAFIRMGIEPPRGILLYGPPGCSKTLMAKALATETEMNFIPIKGPELFSKYVGDSEKAIQQVFRKARAAAPAVVFFDEIDAIGAERGSSGDSNSVHDRVLAQMLNEIDGIEPLKQVLFLAATNRPDIIDKALMRPGRIDRIVYIGIPDLDARKAIFNLKLAKIPHDPSLDIHELASLANGLTGAEITAVCKEACLAAMQDNIDALIVDTKYFELSTKLFLSKKTVTPEMLIFFQNFNKSLVKS